MPLPSSPKTAKRYYRPKPPVETGLKGKCPRCGNGNLFAGFLKLADNCAGCELDFNTEDIGDGPAVFVILIAGIVIVPLAIAFQFISNAPSWLVFIIWAPLLSLFCLGLLRLLRGVMFNLAWHHSAREVRASEISHINTGADETQTPSSKD